MKTLKLLAVALLTLPLAKAQNANISDLKPDTKDEIINVSELTKEELQALVQMFLQNEQDNTIHLKPNQIDSSIDNQFEFIDLNVLEQALQRSDATRTSR